MNSSPLGFNPRVDTERASPFLPDLPINLIRQRRFNAVPIISGMNSQEGVFVPACKRNIFSRLLLHISNFLSEPKEIR